MKEQKGYKLKKVFILTHLLMGDHLTTIGMVRYFSTLNDNVTVANGKNLTVGGTSTLTGNVTCSADLNVT